MQASSLRALSALIAALLLAACSTLQSWVDASNAANDIAAGTGIPYSGTIDTCEGFRDNPRVRYSNVLGRPMVLADPLPLGGATGGTIEFAINPTALDAGKHPYSCMQCGPFPDGWYLQQIQGIAVKNPAMCPLGGTCDAFITRVCKGPGLTTPCSNATTPTTGSMGCGVCGPVQYYPH